MTAEAKSYLPQAMLASGSPTDKYSQNKGQLVIVSAASVLHKKLLDKTVFFGRCACP